MGFLNLTLENELDLTKVIISLWFRVPIATATALRSASIPGTGSPGGVLPLICFGPQQSIFVPDLNFNQYTDSYCSPNPYPAAGFSSNWTGAASSYLGGPSFIGVFYGSFLPDSCLITNIQTNNGPSLSGVYFGETSVVCNHGGPNDHTWTSTFVDQSVAYESIQDAYTNASGRGGSLSILTATDKWHHLLLSWDLTNGCSSFSAPSGPDQNFVTSVSKMWCAFDDVGKSGSDLPSTPANNVSDIAGWGPNDIVSLAVGKYAGSINGNATASLIVNSITSSPITIPGPATVTSTGVVNDDGNGFLQSTPVQQVEMAELQMWAGQTIDVGDLSIRRLFVDPTGFPVDMSVAKGVFNTPDIALSGQSNWQAGINTGSAGDFTPTGTINPFTPGPSIGA